MDKMYGLKSYLVGILGVDESISIEKGNDQAVVTAVNSISNLVFQSGF